MRTEGLIHNFIISLKLDQRSILTLKQVAWLFEKLTRHKQTENFLHK